MIRKEYSRLPENTSVIANAIHDTNGMTTIYVAHV